MDGLATSMLGRTGLEVTRLGYGAMELQGRKSDEAAVEVLNAALDAGINFIDTAPDYLRSEELIGNGISHRRSEFFLASKCWCTHEPPEREADGSYRLVHEYTAENVRKTVEESLRRLKTDHLDLVQFHISPSRATLESEGGLEEALALKRSGKVRFVGMSGILPNLVDHIEMGVFDAFQIPYSAIQREHEDAIARASAAGAGIIIRGGMARGVPGDWEKPTRFMVPVPVLRDRWETANLDELLDGMDRMEFMLRFTLSNPDLDTTIVGTRNPEHLRSNVAWAMKGPLAAGVVAEAKRRLAAAGSGPA